MDRIYYILTKYLRTTSYRIDKESFRLRLLSDPNNNLVAITNTLDFFDIKNIAVSVPKTTFSKLPEKFIAHVRNNSQESFVLVLKEKNNKIKLIIDDITSYLISIKEFLHNWTGLDW